MHQKKYRFLALALASAAALHACAESNFTRRPARGPDDPGAQPSDAPGETNDVVKVRIEALEMAPLEVRLPAGLPIDSSRLPAGAIVDEETHELRWLPKRGQAGLVTIGLGDETRPIELEINVAALDEARLKAGPLDVYRDEDVGYVFVHGLTQRNECVDEGFALNYWSGASQVIAPLPALRTNVCYDSSRRVQDVVPSVARQIASAPCGRFDRCVVVVHSMGGLMLEHILATPAVELHKKVKDRVLMVLALGSAAGGSESANIIVNPGAYPFPQNTLGQVLKSTAFKAEAVQDLTTARAAILAPITNDPGVPFFMIPGFSVQHLSAAAVGGVVRGDPVPATVFNGDGGLAAADALTGFTARSDGVISFRSGCGIASVNEKDGPGRAAVLADHLAYCFEGKKKPNHYVWFAMNLNHNLIKDDFGGCASEATPCEARFPNAAMTGFEVSSEFRLMNTPRIVRTLLTRGAEDHERVVDVTDQLPSS